MRRFLWDDEIVPLEKTAEIVATSERLFQERQFGLFGAWLREQGDLIGFGGFWYFREPPELKLLFGVAESHWGRGHATRIARVAVEYGFAVPRFNRISASTDAANQASVRVLTKLGFRPLRRAVVGGLDTRLFELERGASG